MQLIINFYHGKTLVFRGELCVKYSDVTSGVEGMNMIVRISGANKSYIENPFLIFKNKDGHYPILGVRDDILDAIYRTGPKGWIDSRVMV